VQPRAGVTPAARAGASFADPSSSSDSGQAQAGSHDLARSGEIGSSATASAARAAGATSSAQASGTAADAQPGAPAAASAASANSEASPLSGVASGAQASSASPGTGAVQTSAAGVPMQDMIDSIRATIALTVRQGATQARIALQPQELGQISIHLSQTAEGLLARVTAETPAAAQALAGGRAELHQSLSSLGVSLLRLDIGSSGHSQAGDREGRFAGSEGSSAHTGSSADNEGETAQPPGEPAGADPPAGLEAGGLVDVLA
jgi:flagellar hook-length control protein FliK